MNHEPRLSLSEEEARIERAMDTLAASERATSPAGLEGRVFQASVASLRTSVAPAASVDVSPSVVVRHVGPAARGARRRTLAIAAGLAAIACVTAAWLALRTPGGGAPAPQIAEGSGDDASVGPAVDDTPGSVAAIQSDLDAEVEALFAASSMLDTGLDDKIASIRVDAAALGLDLADPLAGSLGGLSDGLTGSALGGESL